MKNYKKVGGRSMSNMRRFQLKRDIDESGVSGTGIVAEGIEFTSGVIAMTWYSPHRAVNVYESIKTLEALHGHEGKTKIIFID
jgi:hypothetical protein